jgi:hypothetical protein
MILEKVEITPLELDSLTAWFLDSLVLMTIHDPVKDARLFAEMRNRLQLWPNFRVVTWRKPD